MITVEVSTAGLDFNAVAQTLSGPLLQQFLENLADIGYTAAFWGAPQGKTGKLAASITRSVEGNVALISALAPEAVFVEKGTRPHQIRPVNARCLAFTAKSGDMVFTKLVNHPGTAPNPFMHNAAETARSKVGETFAELWLELI